MSFRRLLVLVALTSGCAPPAPPVVTPIAPVAAPARADASPEVASRPPVARREPKVTDLHGMRLTDDFAWLRKKDSPEVLAYLGAENAYTDALMRPTLPLQETLYRELLGRTRETDMTVPVKRGDWLYYQRVEAGKPYRIFCRRKSVDAPEVVLLDLNEIGKKEKYVGVGPFTVSDDGNLLAFGLDTTGYRQFDLQVKDLRTGVVGADRVPRVDAAEFARDGRTLYYVTEDATTKRADTLHRHVVGDDTAHDAVVYREPDEMFDLELERSRSKDFLFLTSFSKTTTEVRVLSASDPHASPRVVLPREHDHEYHVDHAGPLFYIRTNSGGRNFRLVTTPVADTRKEKWKEILPHRADVMLEDVMLFADHMVLEEREDALPRLSIAPLSAATPARIEMPEPIYSASADANPEFATHVFRYRYQSPVTPLTVVEEDVRTHARAVLKRFDVPNYDAARYEVARVHATARDGTRVPVSLLYAKGARPDRTHALYMEGYGAYGIPSDARFSPNVLSLVDRGAVYAVAHIRGGGDQGKAWHDAGRMMSKMNSFTDFIDVAEHLVATGWATPGRIGIGGRSAGGLLMGAVTNMRPDLWRAVVAGVPFTDVMNTMLDRSLPLTASELEEWGNPADEAAGRYMMQYSPYDNIAAKAYPAILVTTSYNDSQVMYWEPAKYVARLRATKTDASTLLLKTDMDPAGHGGKSDRYAALRDRAFEYAFLLSELGLAR